MRPDLTTTDFTAWFRNFTSHRESNYLIFCLPHSGAGSSVFQSWGQALPPGLEIAAVRLPGREQRHGEPPDLHPEEIAAAIAARTDRPYVIFGHSMGARLGFEVIRVLRRLGAPPPLCFYPAAARPPDVEDPIARVAEYDDDRCVSALIELLDAPVLLRDEPELRELYLPILRSDLRWLREFGYQPQPPLDVPIVAMAGEADSQNGPDTMLGWSRHTSATFRLHTLPGGHFFPQVAAAQVIGLIADHLAGLRADDGRRDLGAS